MDTKSQLDADMAPTGKASVSVAGPGSLPLVGGAEIGLQRNADGSFTAGTGEGTQLVSAQDVRKILGGSSSVDPTKPKDIRLPGCADLRRPGRGAFYSATEFEKYALCKAAGVTGVYSSKLPGWLLETLIETCRAAASAPLRDMPARPGPDYNDLPPPSGDVATA